jgi:hypothetical protein
MKRRIAFWAFAGFAVATFWFIFGLLTWPNHNFGYWTIVAVTAPASLLGRHMPLAYYWFIILNAGAYGFVGMAAELLRVSVVRLRPS